MRVFQCDQSLRHFFRQKNRNVLYRGHPVREGLGVHDGTGVQARAPVARRRPEVFRRGCHPSQCFHPSCLSEATVCAPERALTHPPDPLGFFITGAGWGGGGGKNRQTTPATTSVRQLLGTTNAQTTPAATSTAPAHQSLGSTNVETTPAGALAAASDKTQ